MNIDQQIKQALNDEFNQIVSENEHIDANPFKQMKEGFSGKMKWIYIQVVFYSVVFFGVTIFAIFRFYHAQELKSLLAWGITVVVFALMTQMAKMWYWSELGRNRVIREVKLLELQVAQLSEQISKK